MSYNVERVKPSAGKGKNAVPPPSLLIKPSKTIDCPSDEKFEDRIFSLSNPRLKQLAMKISLVIKEMFNMTNKNNSTDINAGALGLGRIGKGISSEIPNLLGYQRRIVIKETEEVIFSDSYLNKYQSGDC